MYEAFSSLRPYVFGFTSRPLCPGRWSVPWLRRLVTALSPSRHVFDSCQIHVKFGVGILTLRQAYLPVIRFSPVSLTAFLSGQESEVWSPSNNAVLFRKLGALKTKVHSLLKGRTVFKDVVLWKLAVLPTSPVSGVKKRISISAVSYTTTVNTVVEIVSLFVF